MSKFVASPGYRRVLWRAYEELANGIMNNTNADPVINARYAAFQAEGITASAPTALKSWIRSRHNYLVSQVRSANAPFAVTTAGGWTSKPRTTQFCCRAQPGFRSEH